MNVQICIFHKKHALQTHNLYKRLHETETVSISNLKQTYYGLEVWLIKILDFLGTFWDLADDLSFFPSP